MKRIFKPSTKPIRANFKPVKLAPDQLRKWDETLATCNWVGPGFVHIMYTMLVPRGRTMAALFTEDMHWVAATDGFQIIIKPSRYFQLTLMKRVFIMFHEILHNIWDHCGMAYRLRAVGTVTWAGVTVPYIHLLAVIVQDLIINDTLIESRMGEYDPMWLHDPSTATFKDSWVEVYVKLYKECEEECREGQKGRGKGKGRGRGSVSKDEVEEKAEQLFPPDPNDPTEEEGEGPINPRKGQFDFHMDPGTGGKNGEEEDDGPRERSELEWQQAVAAGMAVAKAQGKLPDAMELMFGKILEPVVSWQEHIRAWLARKVGSGGYDWRRPDRRLIVRDIVAPGRTGHGARLIIVGGDNSGSVYADKTLLGRFLGEVGGMLEDINPETIILIWCDATVHEVDEISNAADLQHIQKRGTTGGGGTNFIPVFQWIEDHALKPDAFVYLTDMMGTFPDEAPSYPVIWGSISDPERYPAPFGDLVHIPTYPSAEEET